MEKKLTYEQFRKYVLVAISVFTGILHIGQFTFLPMESIKFYAWHLTLGLILVFLYKPASKKAPKRFLWLDWVCIALTAISGGYVILSYKSEERRLGKECRSRWSPDT